MSNFGFPSAASVARLRSSWPVGSRVELVDLQDAHPGRLVPGCLGSVSFVDDAGTVHVAWDCGSSLGLVSGEDSWRAAPAAPVVVVRPSPAGSRLAQVLSGVSVPGPVAAPKVPVLIPAAGPVFSAPAAAAVFGSPFLEGVVSALRAADLAVGSDPMDVLGWDAASAGLAAASDFLSALLAAGCPASIFEDGRLDAAVVSFAAALSSVVLGAAQDLA